MAETVRAKLEIRIHEQLRGALRVGFHPFAAGEEGCLQRLGAQQIDDASVIAGDGSVGLAKVEGQGDQLFAGRQFDASDRAAQRLRDRRGGGDSLLPQARQIELVSRADRLCFAWRSSQCLRRPAAIEQVRGGNAALPMRPIAGTPAPAPFSGVDPPSSTAHPQQIFLSPVHHLGAPARL